MSPQSPVKAFSVVYRRSYLASRQHAREAGLRAPEDHLYAHRMALFAARSAYRSAEARARLDFNRSDP